MTVCMLFPDKKKRKSSPIGLKVMTVNVLAFDVSTMILERKINSYLYVTLNVDKGRVRILNFARLASNDGKGVNG